MPGDRAIPHIVATATYDTWFSGLRDRTARARILVRVDRLRGGNAGDAKPVGEGVMELRFTFGPGYRVYYVQRGTVLILLLAGGDKASQQADIVTAKRLAKETE